MSIEPPSDCRHCGQPIRRGTRGTWVHVHGLNRCQRLNRRYGYDALPDTGVPCGCVMCTTYGEMTPDVG